MDGQRLLNRWITQTVAICQSIKCKVNRPMETHQNLHSTNLCFIVCVHTCQISLSSANTHQPAGDDVLLELLSVKGGEGTHAPINSYITRRQELEEKHIHQLCNIQQKHSTLKREISTQLERKIVMRGCSFLCVVIFMSASINPTEVPIFRISISYTCNGL